MTRSLRAAAVLALLTFATAAAAQDGGARWTSVDGRVSVMAPTGWLPQSRMPEHITILVAPPGFDAGRDMRVCGVHAEEADPARATPLGQAELNSRMDPWWRQSRWRQPGDTVHSTAVEEVEGVRVFFYDRQSGQAPSGFREVARTFLLANDAGGIVYIVSCRVQLDAMSDGRFAEANAFLASLVINQ